MNKASEKIEKELSDYRKKTIAMKADQVYRLAGQITYTEPQPQI